MVTPRGVCVVARGGMRGCSGGHVWLLPEGEACVVAPGGACVVALGGACVVAPGGACVVASGGGGCMVAPGGGRTWLLGGGGMRGCFQTEPMTSTNDYLLQFSSRLFLVELL